MDPIIDFLGFNIVLEYDNDLLTIPTTHFWRTIDAFWYGKK